MAESIHSQVKNAMLDAEALYHRLVLLVGNSGSGKTATLRKVSKDLKVEVINLNLVLSEILLELTARQRSLRVPQILRQLIDNGDSIVLLDNTEILFDKDLQQDPLRLLQGLSRNCTVIASWNGVAKGKKLIYAEQGHPEYRTHEQVDTPIICMAATTSSH